MNKSEDKRKISILGDSISTLEGYNPSGYNVFFKGEKCIQSGVHTMKDTWWGKVIEYLDGELLVNNSWSGSRVTSSEKPGLEFPAACSIQRTYGLHTEDGMPDVIIVYIGTNDWGYGVKPIGDSEADACFKCFDFAYAHMMHDIKMNYPDAEIYCCTLNKTYMSSNSLFEFPENVCGYNIREYNYVIRKTASETGCGIIDLYSLNTPYDSIDGSHPTSGGMKTLADMMIYLISGGNGEGYGNRLPGLNDYIFLQYMYDFDNARTYLVKDKRQVEYAMKVYCKENNKKVCDEAIRENCMMMRFECEGIPHIYDIFEDERYVYITSEIVYGNVLSDISAIYVPMQEETVVKLGINLAKVIKYLRSFYPEYYNCSISPHNIMITYEGEIKIVGFKNTIRNREIGCECDIRGLGATMYYMATGIFPEISGHKIRRSLTLRKYVSGELAGIIQKCIKTGINNGYGKCEEIIADLERLRY